MITNLRALPLLFSAALLFLTGCGEEPYEKLSVDEVLKEHLESRDQVIAQETAMTVAVRDRIITGNSEDPNFVAHSKYLSFAKLQDDQSATPETSFQGLTVFTDFHVRKVDNFNDARRVAWFIESPKPTGSGNKFVRKTKNRAYFEKIYTCYLDLLQRGEPFVFSPVAMSDMPKVDFDELVSRKSKMVSIIASKKKSAPGHKMRHEAIRKFPEKIDAILGRAYQPIDSNADGLLDFYYNISIENRKEDFYFSEKIVDAILCGTVPIYWGCPSIGKFFNTDGMIIIDSVEELEAALDKMSKEDYESRLPAMRENYRIAQLYRENDKWLRSHLIKHFGNPSPQS